MFQWVLVGFRTGDSGLGDIGVERVVGSLEAELSPEKGGGGGAWSCGTGDSEGTGSPRSPEEKSRRSQEKGRQPRDSGATEAEREASFRGRQRSDASEISRR